MRPPGKQRLAQRHAVKTTPVMIRMRRRGRSPNARTHAVRAALIELSVMGAAVIAPDKWELTAGNRAEMTWEEFTGLVVVRRWAPYQRKSGLYIYGVEYCDGRSLLGPALYDHLVVAAGAAQPPLPDPLSAAEMAAGDATETIAPLAWQVPST